MRPIVDGIERQYRACVQVERIFFHSENRWNDLIGPIGTPEFALLDGDENILYRWVGFTEKEEFTAILQPLCSGT